MRAIYTLIASVFFLLATTAWSSNPVQESEIIDKKDNIDICTPTFCDCLPPAAKNHKSCSSRTPTTKCLQDSKPISCSTFCNDDVQNCAQ